MDSKDRLLQLAGMPVPTEAGISPATANEVLTEGAEDRAMKQIANLKQLVLKANVQHGKDALDVEQFLNNLNHHLEEMGQ